MARKTKISIHALVGKRKIIALTSYNALFASIVDEFADIILVGDSMNMVLYGEKTTVSLTLDQIIFHAKSVVKATKNAFIVVDLPFGSFETSKEQAFKSACRILKETGAQAVKIEGGSEMLETISFLTSRGIPIIGHIGLTPQSINQIGSFKQQANDEMEISSLAITANKLAESGVMALVLEHINDEAARKITSTVNIPTIGIGAGACCDGHVSVLEDLLGLTKTQPPFTKCEVNLRDQAIEALRVHSEKLIGDQESIELIKRLRSDSDFGISSPIVS